MTLLIGGRGKDGVVLGADQKIMRGGEPSYAPKIHQINDVLFATEGLTGLADDFLLIFKQEASMKKGFSSLYDAKTVAEDVVSELTKRYRDRLEDSYMGAILVGLESITSGPAKMYYIHPQGYGETVTFRCTGSGGEYAMSLAKFVHREGESIEENARRIAFVIHWVSETLDAHVGGTPQVAILKDDVNKIQWLDSGEVEAQKKVVESCQADLWNCLCKR